MSKYLARQETAISCEQGFAKNPDKAETKLALKTVVFRPKTENQTLLIVSLPFYPHVHIMRM